MEKQVANESKKLPVPGYEAAVRALRQKLATFKWLKDEVEMAKMAFRTVAKQMAASFPGGDVSSLEFVDPETGSNVLVSLPDVSKTANRVTLKPELLAEYSQNGLDVSRYLEAEESVVLTGEYLQWFTGLLEQWTEQGVSLPANGCEHKRTIRLSIAGVQYLKDVAASGGELAAGLLDAAIKRATVR